jgi:hypothetical protein
MAFSTRKSWAQQGVKAQVTEYLKEHPHCETSSGIDCVCVWGDALCNCAQTIDCEEPGGAGGSW